MIDVTGSAAVVKLVVRRDGELSFTDALASTSESEFDPQRRYHGLIGISVFNGYRVTLDLSRQRLLLAPAGGPEQPGRRRRGAEGAEGR